MNGFEQNWKVPPGNLNARKSITLLREVFDKINDVNHVKARL